MSYFSAEGMKGIYIIPCPQRWRRGTINRDITKGVESLSNYSNNTFLKFRKGKETIFLETILTWLLTC